MTKQWTLAALLCATTSAWASVDCRTVQRPAERAICSNPKLNAADETLGRFYRDALAKLSSESIGIVRADQVQWLTWVQQMCQSANGDAAQTSTCMLPLYEERNRLLRTAVVRREGVTFYTRSQYFAVVDERAEYQKYGQYPGMGTLEARWPQADSTDPQWQAWNHEVEIRALLMAGTGEDTPSQQTPLRPALWSASLAMRRNATVTALLKSVEHGRVTTPLTTETMERPAAHPSDYFESNIWLLAAQRPLGVHDVFATGGQWKMIVGTVAYRSLTSGDKKLYIFPEVNGPEAKPLQDVITEVHNWTLEPDGLHISYPDYSVAPRFAHPDDTIVPWTTLRPVLAAGFVQP